MNGQIMGRQSQVTLITVPRKKDIERVCSEDNTKKNVKQKKEKRIKNEGERNIKEE